ncbi:MAG TPA: urate hydroxylase PuuD [Minicystis sp.]|nr:urate hydroxylase PuuD [Minicystis sp.]
MSDVRFFVEAVLRWVHVFSAILWIGQTYLFNWMEKSLERGNAANPNIVGNLWMVHGGGFYTVEKQKYPELMPRTLHWFKWEAASTWLSGIPLLALVYWTGGALCEPDQNQTVGLAVAIGLLVVGWTAYDLLVRTPLAKNEIVFAAFGFAVLVALAYVLPRYMSARATFIHIGAMIGTIMAANVWMRILPSQRKMLAAAKENRTIDPRLASTGPTRSRHNSYLVLPLVFLMISNHYPTIFGSDLRAVYLGVVLLVGWTAARIFRGPTHKIAAPLQAPGAAEGPAAPAAGE